MRKLYRQKLEKRRKRLEQLSALDPRYVRELGLRESMLEVQAVLLGRVAAEENHITGLEDTSEPSNMSFDERVKEVEDAIQALQYLSAKHLGPGICR